MNPRLNRARTMLLAIVAVLSGALPMSAFAGAGAAQSLNPVTAAVMASQLAQYARQKRDAMAMMVAANLMRSVKLGEPADAQSGAGASGLPSAEDLYAEAKLLADKRKDFLGIIEEAKLTGSRGVVGTVDAQLGRLAGKESRTFTFNFEGDSDAAAGVALPSAARGGKLADADLDLYVYDDKGAPVCISEGPGIPELCRWTPRRTGSFQIKVENRLGTPADFTLIVR